MTYNITGSELIERLKEIPTSVWIEAGRDHTIDVGLLCQLARDFIEKTYPLETLSPKEISLGCQCINDSIRRLQKYETTIPEVERLIRNEIERLDALLNKFFPHL